MDISGNKYGRLTVIRRKENKGPQHYWFCKCDCGSKVKAIRQDSLVSGRIKSCGCLLKEYQRGRVKQDMEKRFWDKVNKTDTCWLWTASKDKRGYGRLNKGKHAQNVLAHRYSYELVHGKIPIGLELDHLKDICGNTSCVNPSHLEPVTHKENLLRGNSPMAINARKTHCPKGHEFNKENTYVSPTGGRECRLCQSERRHNYWLKHRK